jgi:hypothetical protein
MDYTPMTLHKDMELTAPTLMSPLIQQQIFAAKISKKVHPMPAIVLATP